MPGLGETVAELLARRRSATLTGEAEAVSSLALIPSFGSNPGALRMWLHAPAALPAEAPLVVVLHGCGQSAAGYAAGAGWIELADRHGFAVLCPEQVRGNNPNLCFNWFEDADTRRGAGEAESIAQMVRRALKTFDLDQRRVFVTGLSAGGAMAVVMLAAYPELFAAGAVVAGLPYGAASGVAQALSVMRRTPVSSPRAWGDKVRAAAPARWPRVSIWSGDADATVTPTAADAIALQWRDVHGLTEAEAEAVSTCSSRHLRKAWRNAKGDVVVELHTVTGLGHGAPIAAGGVDGCGAPGPWILEAGVSSSLESVRSWGVARTGRPQPASRSRPRAIEAEASGVGQPPFPVNRIGETISHALRSARLLR